jgi:hypothetical protein
VKARYWFLQAIAICLAGYSSTPALSQQNSANSSAAANTTGTSINNQNNTQVNSSAFYGFGPGINCPTTTLSVSGFQGNSNGLTNSELNTNVSNNNVGGMVTITVPLGPNYGNVCQQIGERQLALYDVQIARAAAEARKTLADVMLVTALKCVEVSRLAVLTDQFAELCRGVNVLGVRNYVTPATRAERSTSPASPADVTQPLLVPLLKVTGGQGSQPPVSSPLPIKIDNAGNGGIAIPAQGSLQTQPGDSPRNGANHVPKITPKEGGARSTK